MTRSPRPSWRIVKMFDPEGHGQDFAYTQGLASRAGCELHLWARSTLGQDARTPGRQDAGAAERAAVDRTQDC